MRPILVGGSGLYARAAIDDISFPGTDPQVRKALEEREKTEGAGALFDELKAKDPEVARMDPHNPRRTIRALEVIEVTGRLLFGKPSALPVRHPHRKSVSICRVRNWTVISIFAPSRCSKRIHRRSGTYPSQAGHHRSQSARLPAGRRLFGRVA